MVLLAAQLNLLMSPLVEAKQRPRVLPHGLPVIRWEHPLGVRTVAWSCDVSSEAPR